MESTCNRLTLNPLFIDINKKNDVVVKYIEDHFYLFFNFKKIRNIIKKIKKISN